jgi:erythromycin esterase-like protein
MHRSMERLLSRADSNDRFALMSHNMHLAKDIASIEVFAGAGPGGGQVESIGTFLARRMPDQVFSIWMLCGRGRDSQPLSYMSNEVRSPKDSLNEMLCDIEAAFVLPLSGSDSFPAVLDRKIPFVTNGNVVNRAVLSRQTDAIFFVRDVTPLRDFPPAP